MFALTLSGYWLGAVCLNAFGTFSLTNSFALKKNALFPLYNYKTILKIFILTYSEVPIYKRACSLKFFRFFSTLLAIFHAIDKNFHPARLLIYFK